jgi:hypothetical protein
MNTRQASAIVRRLAAAGALVIVTGCAATVTVPDQIGPTSQSSVLGAAPMLAQTTLTLTTSKNSVAPGGLVVLAGQLPKDASGDVYFGTINTDGTVKSTLGSASLRDGYAILDLPAAQLSPGTNSLVAVFRGDSHYEAAESDPVVITLG